MRALLQIALFIFALGAVMVVGKGLTPMFPGVGAILRLALHPVGIALLLALFFLMRLGMMRRRTSTRGLGSGLDPDQKSR